MNQIQDSTVIKKKERVTKVFIINGELIELPLFMPGDRVKLKGSDFHKNVNGTVEKVEHGGLLVHVKWDKEEYENDDGIITRFGSKWIACGIEFL